MLTCLLLTVVLMALAVSTGAFGVFVGLIIMMWIQYVILFKLAK